MSEAATAPLTAARDKLGRLFDAQKFKPAFDTLGRWINLRAGRRNRNAATKPKMSPAPSPAPQSPETAAEPPPAAVPEAPAVDFSDIERAAKTAAIPEPGKPAAESDGEAESLSTSETLIGMIQLALMLIGDDEGVLSDVEKQMLRRPLERVLKKYEVGADVLPAELELAAVMASLVIKRLKKPKTGTFFGKIRLWFAGKVARREGERIANVVTPSS